MLPRKMDSNHHLLQNRLGQSPVLHQVFNVISFTQDVSHLKTKFRLPSDLIIISGIAPQVRFGLLITCGQSLSGFYCEPSLRIELRSQDYKSCVITVILKGQFVGLNVDYPLDRLYLQQLSYSRSHTDFHGCIHTYVFTFHILSLTVAYRCGVYRTRTDVLTTHQMKFCYMFLELNPKLGGLLFQFSSISNNNCMTFLIGSVSRLSYQPRQLP